MTRQKKEKTSDNDLQKKSLLICTQVVDTEHPILGFFHGWILEFAQYFGRIDVICLAEGKHDLPPHVHVHSLGKESKTGKARQLLRFYHLFWQYYQRQGVDYVFYHMGDLFNVLGAPFYFTRSLFCPKTKFYWWKTHGQLKLLGKLASRCVDCIFTASEKSFANKALRHVHVIGHAVDEQLFARSHQSQWSTCNLLAVGRVTPIKELEVAIRCIAELRQRHQPAILTIIGPANDLSYQVQLQHEIEVLKIADMVTFYGSVTQQQLAVLYQQHQFLINAARGAGFDKVILEAGLSGTIPLTSTPSYQPLLGKYKLFIPDAAPAAYAQRIVELMKNQQEYNFIASQLRRDVVAKHSLSTLTKRIFGVP